MSVRLQAKYREITENEVLCEQIDVDDAEILLIGYGIVARILRRVVGLCAGPPASRRDCCGRSHCGRSRPTAIANLAARIPAHSGGGIEQRSDGRRCSSRRGGQEHRISFYGRMGGNVPAAEEIVEQVRIALGQIKPGIASQESQESPENRGNKGSEVGRVEALA